jgi:hypothetical protein
VGTVGGNAWFAGTPYVAFLTYYQEMLRALMEMKEVDGKTQVTSMNMMVELAEDTAEAILDAAETRFWEHIAMAIVDGASACMTMVLTFASVAAMAKQKPEVEVKPTKGGAGVKAQKGMTVEEVKQYNLKWQRISTLFEGASRASQSAEKSINNVIQGVMELKAAQYEAQKEMLQTFRQVQQTQADRSLELFRQNSELITQLIQQIDQMRSKIIEAQMKALSRSS